MSEWDLECLLQDPWIPSNDVVVVDQSQSFTTNDTSGAAATMSQNDPEECQRYLKRQLELACAFVAFTKESSKRTQDFTAQQDIVSQAPPIAVYVDEPVIQNNNVIMVESTTSGSSKQLSEKTQNADATDVKRDRRMISNRESARRSRRRKQDQLAELEAKAAQMRIEHSALLKRLSDVNQKRNEAAVDNRVLKANVETMKAKVKMAEENVKRIIPGFNPMVQHVSNLSTMGSSTDDMNQQHDMN